MMTDMKLWTLLAVAAVGVLSLADYHQWRSTYGELTASIREVGLAGRVAGLDHELRRQASPARATIRAAWLLLATELDRSWLEPLTAEERTDEARLGIQRLELASQLAAEGLAAQPVSWRAAAVLGSSRYLLAQRRRDRERPAAAWREPLLAAMRLAPGHPEPPRLFVSASLSAWSRLAPSERDATLPVLARAFADRHSFGLLIPAWVRIAPSLGRLLEPIPDRPWAWDRLGQELLALGDRERFCIARRRWYESTAAELPAWVTHATARLRGDRGRAADTYRAILAQPPDVALAGSVAAALATLPPELIDDRMRRDLHGWLRWALDLCVAGFCPFAAETMRTIGERLGDLEGGEAAMAALLANDPDRARLHESLGAPGGDERWDRYLVLKARWLLDGGRAAEARDALDRVAADRRDDPLYWLEAERLARQLGDRQALAAAEGRLTQHARTAWPAGQWRYRNGVYRLELLASRAATGIRIEPTWAPAEGSVFELRLDGRERALLTVEPGAAVRWRLPVTAGLHLLELFDALGRRATAGAVSLEPAPPPPPPGG